MRGRDEGDILPRLHWSLSICCLILTIDRLALGLVLSRVVIAGAHTRICRALQGSTMGSTKGSTGVYRGLHKGLQGTTGVYRGLHRDLQGSPEESTKVSTQSIQCKATRWRRTVTVK